MSPIIDRRKFLLSLPGVAIAPRFLTRMGRRALSARALNHATLSVSDPERSVEFYQGLFGMPIQARQGGNDRSSAGRRAPVHGDPTRSWWTGAKHQSPRNRCRRFRCRSNHRDACGRGGPASRGRDACRKSHEGVDREAGGGGGWWP